MLVVALILAAGLIAQAQTPTSCQGSIDAAIALLKPLEPLLTPKGVTNLRSILTRLQTLKTQCKPVQPAPNVSPEVMLTAPSLGSTYTAPATVLISASASDSDGTIAKVEFFAGSSLLNVDTASPYQFSWTGVAVGSYSLTAKATDDKGASKVSSAIPVIVGPAPVPVEICGNGIDDDKDGEIDEGCVTPPPPSGEAHAYFNSLCKTPGALCYSLREQAMIDKYRHPGEVKVNFDPQTDAARWQWIKNDESADNLRLPISLSRPASGTSKLLIIADHRWDDGWFTEFKQPDGRWMGGWKWMQVTVNERVAFEPQLRAVGEWAAEHPNETPRTLAVIGAREYLGVQSPTTSTAAIGCGVDFGDSIAINRQQGCFKARSNTWTRTWIEIAVTAGNEFASISFWVADEAQDPVAIFEKAQVRMPDVIDQFWYEYDTSRPERMGGAMAAWGRNVIVLKDVDAKTTFQKPVSGPAPPASSFSCGTTGNQFWENLKATAYTIYSASLRTAEQAKFYTFGGPGGFGSNGVGKIAWSGNDYLDEADLNGPGKAYSYDPTEDAILAEIPEFGATDVSTGSFQLAAPVSSISSSAISITPGSQMDMAQHFRCPAYGATYEIFQWNPSGDPSSELASGNLTVSRADRDATNHPAQTHASGTWCRLSGNSVRTQMKLPNHAPGLFGTCHPADPNCDKGEVLNSDGDTYLIIWDMKLDESNRVDKSGMTDDVFKDHRLYSYGPGGSHHYHYWQSSISLRKGADTPPGYNPTDVTNHVAYLAYRCMDINTSSTYNQNETLPQWSNADIKLNQADAACIPTAGLTPFIIDKNKWFRRYQEMKTTVGDWDKLSSWARSEPGTTGAALTRQFNEVRSKPGKATGAPETDRAYTYWDLTVDSSKTSLEGRAIGNTMKRWVRNFWIGKNVPQATRDAILGCNVVK